MSWQKLTSAPMGRPHDPWSIRASVIRTGRGPTYHRFTFGEEVCRALGVSDGDTVAAEIGRVEHAGWFRFRRHPEGNMIRRPTRNSRSRSLRLMTSAAGCDPHPVVDLELVSARDGVVVARYRSAEEKP